MSSAHIKKHEIRALTLEVLHSPFYNILKKRVGDGFSPQREHHESNEWSAQKHEILERRMWYIEEDHPILYCSSPIYGRSITDYSIRRF